MTEAASWVRYKNVPDALVSVTNYVPKYLANHRYIAQIS